MSCSHDTDGDGDCGRLGCPECGGGPVAQARFTAAVRRIGKPHHDGGEELRRQIERTVDCVKPLDDLAFLTQHGIFGLSRDGDLFTASWWSTESRASRQLAGTPGQDAENIRMVIRVLRQDVEAGLKGVHRG